MRYDNFEQHVVTNDWGENEYWEKPKGTTGGLAFDILCIAICALAFVYFIFRGGFW